MNFKKAPKIIGITLISIILLMVFLSIGLNFFINKQLPKIINEKNDTGYLISYSNLNFSIFNNTISIEDVKISPENNKKDADKFYLEASVNSIDVSGVDFYDLLKNKNINASSIYIISPKIAYFKSVVKDTVKSKSNFINSISIDKISVSNANVKVKNHSGDSLINEVFNLNAKIDVLQMGEYTADKNIPFTYSNYEFSVDSVFTKLNNLQYVKTDGIQINKSNFDMNNFRILSIQDLYENNKIKVKPNIEVVVPKLNLKGTDWGFKNSNFYVNVSQINIDSVNFLILNNKKTTNNISSASIDSTKNYSLIPFNLNIDDLNIKKSSFNSMGVFDVQNVNINIKGISNQAYNKLQIKEFSLNKPHIIQVAKNNQKKKSKNKSFELNNKIIIDNFKINEATYALKDKTGKKNELVIQNFNLGINQLTVDDNTLKNKIPFTYKNPHVSTGKIHFDSGEFYNIYTNGIILKNNTVTVTNLKMIPKLSRKAFNAKLKYGTDLFNVNAAKVELTNLDWGFNKQNIFYLKFNEVNLNGVVANIYRNTGIANKPGLNKLYSQKLRDLKFGLDVGKINIKNSTLTYEEEAAKSLDAGKLTFTNFNAKIDNIYSGYGKKNGSQTKIEVNSNFMANSKVHVNWTFNIMNKSDNFNINGTVSNLPAESMNPFIKPYLNVSASGDIEEVSFNFTGNNLTANGTFGMNYEHLRITLYKKNGEKERKLLSAIGNLALKKNTRGKTITSETKTVERKLECGFFNFLWLNLKQGIKQTLI